MGLAKILLMPLDLLASLMEFINDRQIAKIAGIPVILTRDWLLYIVVLSGWLAISSGLSVTALTVGTLIAAYGFVLLHEFGHALAANYVGYKTKDIRLMPLSGAALIPGDWIKNSKHELIITIAGPLVNFVLAGLFGLWYWGLGIYYEGLAIDLLGKAFVINLSLGIFNLLPFLPMDGGRILRSLLGMWCKDSYKATDWALTFATIALIPTVLAIYFYTPYFIACLILPMMLLGGYAERATAFMKFSKWSNDENHLRRKIERRKDLSDDFTTRLCDHIVDDIIRGFNAMINTTTLKESDKFLLHAKCLAIVQKNAYEIINDMEFYRRNFANTNAYDERIAKLSIRTFNEAKASL